MGCAGGHASRWLSNAVLEVWRELLCLQLLGAELHRLSVAAALWLLATLLSALPLRGDAFSRDPLIYAGRCLVRSCRPEVIVHLAAFSARLQASCQAFHSGKQGRTTLLFQHSWEPTCVRRIVVSRGRPLSALLTVPLPRYRVCRT